MKIGFVLDDSLDSSDGVQQYVLTLGKWLSSQKHEVHYLVGQTTRTDIDNIHSLARNFKVKFNKNVLSIPLKSSSVEIKQLLDNQSFDVLHVQLPFSPLLAGKLVKFAPKSTSIVGTFHILPYSNLQFAGAKVLSWLTDSMLNKFDKIVSVSPGARGFAKRSMGIESTVVPNAVDLSAFNYKSSRDISGDPDKSDPQTKKIVFLGRLVQRKGCLELLKALSRLNSDGKLDKVEVIIAGDGPDRSKLESFVSRSDLSSKVKFLGRITEDYKPELLASADIVALPSISGESFGIVVVEAIASGAGVVVGGDNPGYSYVLADTPQTLVNPLDTKQFSDLLDKLLSDESKRHILGSIQRDSIAKFDVNIIGEQILDIYKSVIAK